MANKNLFSELENLGFDNAKDLKIYTEDTKKATESQEMKMKSLLYNKTVICPICNNEFKALAVKSTSYRAIKKDSDFFIRYSLINPYFYDVWICNKCGYSSMKSDFEKIGSRQMNLIQEKITPKWHGRMYPSTYDINIAIERYKLALLNYIVMDSKASSRAIICLKIAWMYRLSEKENSEELEHSFLSEALKGLESAYYNERFPLYGMDKFTSMYLIGELYRRLGNYENSLVWLSNVLTIPGAKPKLKDLALDQKDWIREQIVEKKQEEENKTEAPTEDFNATPKKQGIFSKLFGQK